MAWRTLSFALFAGLLGAAVAIAHVEWRDPKRAYGQWTGDVALGAANESLLSRAYRARHQVFSLPTAHALYFYLRRDTEGRPLDGACRYTVRGAAPPGRWWSLTAYGTDGYLLDVTPYSVAAAARDARALSFDIRPPRASPSPAIATRRDLPFYMLLRIYTPASIRDDWAVTLPQVARADCAT